MHYLAAHSAGASPAPALLRTYLPVPPQLLADLRDHPRAIGVYALLARLYLIHHTPIPLSANDLCIYDPTLSYGAARRALQRLVAGGWLMETPGYKNQYRPTWGRTRAGEHRPWAMDTRALGCPTHTMALRIDRRLLDIAMGRLETHIAQPAHTERYLTTPLLTLRDVGAYILCLGGWPARTTTLTRLGFIANGRARPLPEDGQLLALASQQALDHAGTPDIELTPKGLRKLGVTPASASPEPTSGATLFFVAPGVIGHVIESLIGTSITNPTADDAPSNAAECGKTPIADDPPTMPGNPGSSGSSGRNYPPTPQRQRRRGGSGDHHGVQHENNPPPEHACDPDSPMAQALRDRNADPKIIRELAPHPVEWLHTALAYTRTCPNAHDPLALAITLVRNKIADPRYRIPTPRTRHGDPIDWAAIAAQQGWSTDEDTTDMPCEAPPAAGAPTVAALDPLTLTTLVRARLPQALRSLLDHVTIDSHDTAVVLRCTTPTVQRDVERTLVPMLQDVLRQRGDTRPVQLATPPASAPPADDTEPARPDWITGDTWATLPRMLRAALRGSTLHDGVVQGASPALTRVLETRYAREIARLGQSSAR